MELKLARRNDYESARELLIVPYGIETFKAGFPVFLFPLLIVPYGIETGLSFTSHSSKLSFNRTLWN